VKKTISAQGNRLEFTIVALHLRSTSRFGVIAFARGRIGTQEIALGEVRVAFDSEVVVTPFLRGRIQDRDITMTR
jgi:hypothetical protein